MQSPTCASNPRHAPDQRMVYWRLALCAMGSAVLCRLSTYPFDWRPTVLFCWVPLIIASSWVNWRQATLLGLLQGTLLNALVFHWLFSTFHQVAQLKTHVAALLFLVLIILQGARSSLIVLLMSLGLRRGWPIPLIFPLALISAELIYPCLFPWYTSILTRSVPEWMQLAEQGGPFAITGWVGLVNAGCAVAWIQWRTERRKALEALALTLVVVSTVTFLGRWRMKHLEQLAAAAPVARIGVIQGNLAPVHLESRNSVQIYRDASLDLLRRDPNLDLLVWPESAISYPVEETRLREFLSGYVLRSSEHRNDRISVPLLTGIPIKRRAVGATPSLESRLKLTEHFTNSAILTNPRGVIQAQYDKHELIPLSERPLLPQWLRRIFGRPDGAELTPGAEFESGQGSATIDFGTRKLAISICYEELLHKKVLQSIRDGDPDLLINLSSDSWFGDSPAAELHLALATLRAVEHRRYFLRATTTGSTALIGPTGRVEWSLPKRQLAAGTVTVHWLRTKTVYESLGDIPWYLTTVLLLVLIWLPLPVESRSSLDFDGKARQL
jgi:apolipoprotein N-acyltransferase